jgi:hypothetical protein
VNNCRNNCSLKSFARGDAMSLFVVLWIAAGLLYGTAAFAGGPLYLAAVIAFAVWLAAVGASYVRRHVLVRNR